jgi:hypothetical protein
MVEKDAKQKNFTDFFYKKSVFLSSREGGLNMPNTIKNILKMNAPPERVQEILS